MAVRRSGALALPRPVVLRNAVLLSAEPSVSRDVTTGSEHSGVARL